MIGNRTLVERLSGDVSNGTLSHAYILEGPRGSGRHTLALTTIAALSCLSKNSEQNIPCGHCINCKKIFSEQSPDVTTISLEEDKATIGIEAIRNVKDDLHTAPNDLSVKAFIINDADKLTHQAQNAFLLSLEEPPSYILFFLICENSSSLLETIKSRAPILRTQRLSDEEVEGYVLANDKRAQELKSASPQDFSTLISVSAGSIGYALELLDGKKRKHIFGCRDNAKDIIFLLSDPSVKSVFEIISNMGNKRPEVIQKLVFLQYAIRDLLLLKKSDDAPLCFFENRDQALELATHFTSKKLISLYDASVLAIEDLERNANVRLALINMMQSSNLI